MLKVKRGQIYLAILNGIGCEQSGKRPVLILQNDVGNRYSPTTIIAPLTTSDKKKHLPVHVPVFSNRLFRKSMVLLEQVQVIDKKRLGNIWTMDGDGELRLTIMATLAQEESRKVSERVKAGQHISREKKIIYGCGNILGYELKRNIGDDGKWDPSENTYIINPEQAETVRMIFDLYEQGLGAMKIAKELQYRERLTAMGKTKWCATNISKILKNVTYKGYIGYYKSYSNNYLEQKARRTI